MDPRSLTFLGAVGGAEGFCHQGLGAGLYTPPAVLRLGAPWQKEEKKW